MNQMMNGQSRVPPGFRFHPTEEELLHYYLRKKIIYEKIDFDVIQDIDLNKLEPWEIQEKCKIGSTPQNDWYFFSLKDKKYPTGTRTNRATVAGFWKATGRDKVIYSNSKRIGMRKTLVFYKGRAPHGQKSEWIMHEYRLDDNSDNTLQSNASSSAGEQGQEDGWVICRVFKKKSLPLRLDSPNSSSMAEDNDDDTPILHSSRDGELDQIFQYMGRACKNESENININANPITHDNFICPSNMKYIGPIENANSNSVHEQTGHATSGQNCYFPDDVQVIDANPDASNNNQTSNNSNSAYRAETGVGSWVALDRLVASHLNGEWESLNRLASFNDNNFSLSSNPDQDQGLSHLQPQSFNLLLNTSQCFSYNDDGNIWSFTCL